jgi:hypothetical protein
VTGQNRFASALSFFCRAERLKGKSMVSWIRSSVVLVIILVVLQSAYARDPDGRFANSPLKPWFEKLTSGKGPCCSDADGSVVLDSDWESKDGHYRVRIKDKWWDVPAEAVITEPNKVGRTMVWPIYYWNSNSLDRVDIRCFMPGAMT